MPNRQILSTDLTAKGRPYSFRSAISGGTQRIWLRIGVLLVSCGFVLVAASQSRPDLIAARLGLSDLTSEGTIFTASKISVGNTSVGKTSVDKTSAELSNLAGFQRRGNSLVGEVKTRDGAVMRLVFDARTHTLIGLRVLDPVDQRAHEAAGVKACINQTSTAPLPDGVSPAN